MQFCHTFFIIICKVFHSQYTFVIIMIVHIQQISSDAYH